MNTPIMSVEQFRELKQRNRSKYGSKKTVVDGRTFDSKLEARRYEQLMMMKRAGEVRLVLCQVPFWIAPGVRYVVDFMVVRNPVMTLGDVAWFEDVKGHLTQTSRTKIKTVEHLYGITINILTKKEIGE